MADLSDLVDGFLRSRVAGISDAHMREEASVAGWSATDIETAFSGMESKVPHGEMSPVASIPFMPASSKSSFKVPVLIGIGVLGLILIGGIAYAYVEKMGPFAKAPYQEDNLLSGLLAKSSEIDSSAYKAGFALYMKGREADAKPLTLEIKDSSSRLYLPSEPPKAFLEQLSEYAMYIPPEINIQSSVSVVAGKNAANGDSFDWKVGLDGSGDLGDLSYKVNVEALKYASDYYVKINNMPAPFGGFLPPKGQWVRFNASSSDEAGSMNPFISPEDLAQTEEDFKDNRAAFLAVIKKTAEFADKERLFSFKNKPQKEKVGERSLYRYDLSVRKEAIVPFYKKLAAEAVKAEYKVDDITRIGEGYLKYLESSEFSEMFDYYNKNISVTLWTDQKGFPAMLKYAIRIVPPDDVISLKDKQLMLEFTVSLEDINEPLRIDRPESSKTYEEVMKENGNPFEKFIQRVKSSTLKASLGSLFW